jgi:uncharacterized repeat protein (TIGR01451 family)
MGVDRSVSVIQTIAPDATGSVSATASTTSTTNDPDTGNNSVMESTTVESSADLSAALSDSPDPVVAGESLTYTASTTNAGPSDATDVQISVAIPVESTFVSATPSAGGNCVSAATVDCTWTGATPPSASHTVDIVVDVQSSATGTLSATATVSSATADPDSGNDAVTEDTTVELEADLQVQKDDGRSGALIDDVLVYTITVANAGPSDVVGANLADTIPAGLGSAVWACAQGTSTATCPVPPDDAGTGDIDVTVDLPAGTFLQYELSATVTGTTGSTITNTATIAPPAGVVDPDSGNDTASDDTLIVPIGIFGDGFEGMGRGLSLPAAIEAHSGKL